MRKSMAMARRLRTMDRVTQDTGAIITAQDTVLTNGRVGVRIPEILNMGIIMDGGSIRGIMGRCMRGSIRMMRRMGLAR